MLKKAPNAPKRFKSAYICFVMEKMDEVKATLPSDTKVKNIKYLDFSFQYYLDNRLDEASC